MAALTKRQKADAGKLRADKAGAEKGIKAKDTAQDQLLSKFENASLSPENRSMFNTAYAKWLQAYAESRTKGWLD